MKIDLRSDSSIPPTALMREAMARAGAGDDFYGENPVTTALEERAASFLGKEAALLLPTGTMANATAILAAECEPDRIFMDARSHIFLRERECPSILSSFRPSTSDAPDGCPDPARISAWLAADSRLALICTENTHLWRGGVAVPVARLAELFTTAKNYPVHIHMDGARLFNAAEALGISPAVLAETADSVMISLVKGLGAPVGALLAGPAAFIRKSRGFRQILGGTIRQSGLIAAAAHVALDSGFHHIAEDHRHARLLAHALALSADSVETNIVLFDPAPHGFTVEEFLDAARERGVWLSALGPHVRAVTHQGVTGDEAQQAALVLSDIIAHPR